jgi:hypothetical protein
MIPQRVLDKAPTAEPRAFGKDWRLPITNRYRAER